MSKREQAEVGSPEAWSAAASGMRGTRDVGLSLILIGVFVWATQKICGTVARIF